MRRDIAENMEKIVNSKYSGIDAQEDFAGVCPLR